MGEVDTVFRGHIGNHPAGIFSPVNIRQTNPPIGNRGKGQAFGFTRQLPLFVTTRTPQLWSIDPFDPHENPDFLIDPNFRAHPQGIAIDDFFDIGFNRSGKKAGRTGKGLAPTCKR